MDKNSDLKNQDAIRSKRARTTHAADQIGIYRGFDSARGGDYLHVLLLRNGKQYQKYFCFNRCGGEQMAMKLAQAWRDVIVARHPPMSMSQFCAIVRGNNTSGVPGVYRCEKSHSTKIGRVSTVYWQARIPLADGKHRLTNFSVPALGEDEAKARAIAARLRGLRELDNIVFRATRQPQPVSTTSDIEILEAALLAPVERKVDYAAKRDTKRKLDQERLAEKLTQAAYLEKTALETATNATGEPYIGRYQNTKGIGHYWRVSIIRKGIRYRKTFSDAIHGGADAALSAAKAWRDQLFLTLQGDSKAAVVARIKASNTSGVAGVTRARAERKGQIFHYWVASEPKVKGRVHRSKRYSVAKHGDAAAFTLAANAREAFVNELRDVESRHHRAARQMQSRLRDQDESLDCSPSV